MSDNKRKVAAEEDSPPAKRPAPEQATDKDTAKWLITLVSVSDADGVSYTDMCYAETAEMKDAMLLLYDRLHKAIERAYTGPRTSASLRYQRMAALEETFTGNKRLHCLLRPPVPCLMNSDVLRALVQCCKLSKTPLTYLACMYRWNKAQRHILTELMLEDMGDAETCALKVTNNCHGEAACYFQNEFSDEERALIWLELQTDLMFVDGDRTLKYYIKQKSFAHVPPEFIRFARKFIDGESNFWCFTRADIRAAVASWLEDECKEKECV